MKITMYLTKLECNLTDLRTEQEEEQELILDTDDYEEAESRAKKHFERLGYKVNATHIADSVMREWDSEELWSRLIEEEIEERKDFKCEKCRNYQKKNFFSNKEYCDDCVRKDMYEPIEAAEEESE